MMMTPGRHRPAAAAKRIDRLLLSLFVARFFLSLFCLLCCFCRHCRRNRRLLRLPSSPTDSIFYLPPSSLLFSFRPLSVAMGHFRTGSSLSFERVLLLLLVSLFFLPFHSRPRIFFFFLSGEWINESNVWRPRCLLLLAVVLKWFELNWIRPLPLLPPFNWG